MKDLILTPYAPNLVESTRSIGYSFETALADIIDNSISNFTSRVDVKFSSTDIPYVAIIDNGIGMSTVELEKAMRYGSSSSLEERGKSDLGRFGLGLKMASMSQCRKLTVISKQRGIISAATWDLDYIHQTEDWSLKRYKQDEISNLRFSTILENYDSGTIVLWEELDRISESPKEFDKEFNEKLNLADKHMALVYHRFLENKLFKQHFELFFNNRKVEPIDPYILSNRATQQLEEETLFIDQIPIKITPYITPYVSKLSTKERQMLNEYKDLNLKQGLYIYRNNRLLIWGKWFRLLTDGELKRLAKIRIDIPNNIDTLWAIDVKKSSAQIPSMIKEQLKQIVLRVVGKSERVYRYRGRKVTQDSYQHIWNKIENREKMQYLVNRDIPIFKAIQESLNDEQYKLIDGFIKSIEDNFPYSAVYYDLAQDEQFEDKTLEIEQVYEIAKNTINTLASVKDEQFKHLRMLSAIDMFQKYPEVIRMLEEELNENE
ncbi:ATP-binding protein [uncultured Psychrobacillus sp.]|uniref:ATP-binding protein n=1 Tax=uncultured Psychrobacillus sp. TaxID=1551585 RepID=UPI002605A2BC|nr:ATP-binding protein [uncultured Psychrobacillus sp.]